MRVHLSKKNNQQQFNNPAAALHVQSQLRRLAAMGKVLHQGGRTFVSCPFHMEKTPSCIVTTTVGKFQVGSFKCLGCGEHGPWNRLAEALNLAPFGQDLGVAKVVQEYNTSFYDNMLKDKYCSYKKLLDDLEVKDPLPMKGKEWRTLPKKFMEKVGACQVTGTKDGTPYLFLPAYIEGDLVGAIRAVMKDTKDKSVVKYKNSSGTWSRGKGLYPYDVAVKAMDEFEKQHGFRALLIVEGARDALCFNCEGMPTMGVLGTQSWCSAKMDRILDANPDWIGVCMDGDAAGRKAEQTIWEDISRLVPSRKINLTKFNKECGKEVDPGNAPPWVIEEVWKEIHRKRVSRNLT